MKNLPFILLLSMFIFNSCGCHYYGIKSGLNVTTINDDNTVDFQPKLGFNAGGYYEICIDDFVSVIPEVQYSQQGAKYSESTDTNGTLNLDYIYLPVTAKYKLTNALAVEAGPQVGLLLSAKDNFKSPIDSGLIDIKDDLNAIDFGVNFGLHYDLQNGWLLGARYGLGLSNINDTSDVIHKNRVLQFSVAFKFQ
jgi:hypothetical protein